MPGIMILLRFNAGHDCEGEILGDDYLNKSVCRGRDLEEIDCG